MAKEKITGAEALMRSLEHEGVTTLFGYPGGAIMPVYDALYGYKDKLNHVLVRHEQGATHAAQGYARVSGKVGVTSGPGATNTITGIADAMMDSTPIVVIAGQVGASLLGSDAFQECDLVGVTQPISKWAYQIRRPEDVAWAVSRAFYIAKSGRPGPVVLDFAKNAQVGLVDYEPQGTDFIRSYVPVPKTDPWAIRQAAALINNAKRPFILVGQGVELGGAHYCFCSKQDADEEKDEEQNIKFEDPCKRLSLDEAKKRVAAGEPYVIRQTISKKGKSKYHDEVYGDIEIDYDELDEGVLLKSDGFPTYNFANVVDDHLMNITHVVRGNEYISSTPKYNLIYESFGWTPPHYVHVPPVMKDAQHKLSKRNGDASFQDLVAKGYLPEAIINYIALLGWNPGNDEEIFTLDELKKIFTVERLNRSPAIFDIVKLTWMNGQYIRKLSDEEFAALAMPYIEKVLSRKVDVATLCKVLQLRIETLGDIPGQIDFLENVPEYANDLYINKKMKTDVDIAKQTLAYALEALEKTNEWTNDNLFAVLKGVAEEKGIKNGQIMYPVRIALSGKETTPGGATELAVILGKDESLKRLGDALKKLG